MGVLVAVEDFGSHHQRSAQSGCSQIAFLEFPGEAQIRDLYLEGHLPVLSVGCNFYIFDEVLDGEARVKYLLPSQVREIHHGISEFQIAMHAVL